METTKEDMLGKQQWFNQTVLAQY